MTMTKVNLVNQMKRMKRKFIKLLFLSAVIYFKNFNTKHIFKKLYHCFLLLVFVFPLAELIFISHYIFHPIVFWL